MHISAGRKVFLEDGALQMEVLCRGHEEWGVQGSADQSEKRGTGLQVG